MLAFHGTTEENLKSLLAGNEKPEGAWTVSHCDGAFYVYPLNKTMKLETSGTKDEGIESGIIQAFESAKITAALKGETTKLYVLQLDIYSQILEDDYSCENMVDTASFISSDTFNKNMIKSIYVCDFNKWDSPLLIKSLLDNPLFNRWNIDPDLLACAVNQDADSYLDLEFDYSEVAITDFIK